MHNDFTEEYLLPLNPEENRLYTKRICRKCLFPISELHTPIVEHVMRCFSQEWVNGIRRSYEGNNLETVLYCFWSIHTYGFDKAMSTDFTSGCARIMAKASMDKSYFSKITW
jgi:hypothetical protein